MVSCDRKEGPRFSSPRQSSDAQTGPRIHRDILGRLLRLPGLQEAQTIAIDVGIGRRRVVGEQRDQLVDFGIGDRGGRMSCALARMTAHAFEGLAEITESRLDVVAEQHALRQFDRPTTEREVRFPRAAIDPGPKHGRTNPMRRRLAFLQRGRELLGGARRLGHGALGSFVLIAQLPFVATERTNVLKRMGFHFNGEQADGAVGEEQVDLVAPETRQRGPQVQVGVIESLDRFERFALVRVGTRDGRVGWHGGIPGGDYSEASGWRAPRAPAHGAPELGHNASGRNLRPARTIP